MVGNYICEILESKTSIEVQNFNLILNQIHIVSDSIVIGLSPSRLPTLPDASQTECPHHTQFTRLNYRFKGSMTHLLRSSISLECFIELRETLYLYQFIVRELRNSKMEEISQVLGVGSMALLCSLLAHSLPSTTTLQILFSDFHNFVFNPICSLQVRERRRGAKCSQFLIT